MTGDLSGVDFNDNMTEDGRSTRGDGFFTTGRLSSLSSQQHNNMATAARRHKPNLVKRVCEWMHDHATRTCASLVFLVAYLTPIVFAVLPRLVVVNDATSSSMFNECTLECEGALVGIAFKLFVLLLGYWFMYVANATTRRLNKLPRMCGVNVLIVFALMLFTASYWLVYLVRFVFATGSSAAAVLNNTDYFKVLQFTASYVDVLLFVFVISVFLVELRHRRTAYLVRVIRSPDGEQREYDLGAVTIQQAAVLILDHYYRDFKAYNPWAEVNSYRRRRTIATATSQFYSTDHQLDTRKRARALMSASSLGSTNRGGGTGVVDGGGMEKGSSNVQESLAAGVGETESTFKRSRSGGGGGGGGAVDVQSITNIMGTNMSVSERLYEDAEHEKRVRRRRARLVATTEEAFAHIRRIQTASSLNDDAESAASAGGGGDLSSTSSSAVAAAESNRHPPRTPIMDPVEAAQAVLSSIARDLRRYLRVTSQQAFFTRPQIIAHLADCISYDMSPKAFLHKILSGECLLFNERALVNPYNKDQLLDRQEKLSKKEQHQKEHHHHHELVHLQPKAALKPLDQTWILISDNALCQSVDDNLMIVLKQNDVTLMCHFKRLPRLEFIEDVLDPMRNKFIFKLNSETTV